MRTIENAPGTGIGSVFSQYGFADSDQYKNYMDTKH